MTEIIIATRNKNKYNEFTQILSDLPCNFLFAGDFPELPEIAETGSTLLENATLKAKQTAELLGKPCIADDTGFFVRAINYEPGINAAIYAGEGCSYADNVNKLLSVMEGKSDRYCYFTTITVLYSSEKGLINYSEGIIEGELLTSCRGQNGFGYDPLFVPNGYNQTFAEMSDELKNSISHRYLSIKGLVISV
jgi:XTP/dITP diphosphohydrolase